MERLPTVRQLQHLVALARIGHFGRAAAVVGVTQSTLSSSIRELESVLGGPVADRSGRHIRLTPLGEQVADRAVRLVGELSALTAAAREQAAPLAGTLRLGVIPTISPYLLPRLLPGLRQRYPRLRLYLIEDQTARLLEQQEQGELDVLLLALPYDGPGEKITLARDDLLVALPRNHKLAQGRSVTVLQLRAEKLLTLQDGHCLRDHMLSACGVRSSGDERHAATSLLTLVQMVDNGLGLTLVPQLAVKAGLLEGTGLVTRPLAGGMAFRDIALLWQSGAARDSEFRLLASEFKRLFRG